MPRLLTAAVVTPLLILVTLTGGLAALTGSLIACPANTAAAGSVPAAASATGDSAAARWDAEQVANARTILATGTQLDVPARGQVIALATALQESGLRNLHGGDADSLGLFQQRPSAGWGTPTQLLDPHYAATRFYQALLAVPGWQSLPLTQAAQAVQRSGHPTAYAYDETAAGILYQSLTSQQNGATAAGPDQPPAACPATGDAAASGPATGPGPASGAALASDARLAAGITLPGGTPATVARAIVWALAQLGTPYSYGGDCTDPHGPVAAHHCDCSSLTQKAYQAAGLTLPRTTTQQVQVGRPVASLADVQPGDLIFLPGSDGTPESPGHVGLALGHGLLIQAPHTGDVVRITPIAEWAGAVSAIRRLV